MARRGGWRKDQDEIRGCFGPIISDRAYDLDAELARAKVAWDGGGQYGAMVAALRVCQANRLPLPEWVHTAIAEFFAAAVLQAGSGRAEKLRRWLRQRRADLIDMQRVAFLADALNHGLTWGDASEMTAEYYAGTPAGGCTGAAIKKSYRNVRLRAKRFPGRYVLSRADLTWMEQTLEPPRAQRRLVWQKYFPVIRRSM